MYHIAKVIKIYGKLCNASDTVYILLRHEVLWPQVRRTDDEPLQKLFMSVRSELNLDLKNIKQEQAKFWKQHPALVKTEPLIQAQLTHESDALSLQGDFMHVLELAPRFLEQLMKVVPLSSRKATGGSTEVHGQRNIRRCGGR